MSYKIIQLWEAHGDGGERGIGPVIGYARTKGEAETIARGQGWYGGDGSVRQCWAIQLDTGEVFALAGTEPLDLDGSVAKAREAARKQALAKLSPAEQVLLGIK